jgi:hypothetical protein
MRISIFDRACLEDFFAGRSIPGTSLVCAWGGLGYGNS